MCRSGTATQLFFARVKAAKSMDVVEASEDGNNSQLSLQKCISYLKSARSDNERFAALLLVTQLVNSNSLDSAGRRSLFYAVGFNFVNRLLNSSKVPEDCPQDVYRSLALTILACFATDDEFLVHPEMLAKIPQFLAGFSDEEERLDRFTVISFHSQIVPSQIVPINSQIVPQNSQFVPQKSQFVPHVKSQVNFSKFVE